jgi:predicted HAD superfamily Cof-like phosphohydrolase
MSSIPRSPHYNRVLEFMLRAKQDCPTQPTMPSADVRKLRAKLILEEALETIEALGFSVLYTPQSKQVAIHRVNMATATLVVDREPNLTEIVDGCADVSVVTIGTLIACGIKDVPVLECVDENNLAKFGPGHSIREDGKLIKPPGHRPPDIDRVIREQLPAGIVTLPSAKASV